MFFREVIVAVLLFFSFFFLVTVIVLFMCYYEYLINLLISYRTSKSSKIFSELLLLKPMLVTLWRKGYGS